jgi:hypothetical protein
MGSNEILHGGATWNRAVNRSQMTQGADIMGHDCSYRYSFDDE